METKKLSEKVEMILNQFIQEEIGNKLSQFSLFALKSMILSEIRKTEEVSSKDAVEKQPVK